MLASSPTEREKFAARVGLSEAQNRQLQARVLVIDASSSEVDYTQQSAGLAARQFSERLMFGGHAGWHVQRIPRHPS